MIDKLYCDKRSGCVAIYPESRKGDKNGCGRDDERNIAFSDKDATFNGSYWAMNESVQNAFQEAVDAFNNIIRNIHEV
jgi:hypothetical protein